MQKEQDKQNFQKQNKFHSRVSQFSLTLKEIRISFVTSTIVLHTFALFSENKVFLNCLAVLSTVAASCTMKEQLTTNK